MSDYAPSQGDPALKFDSAGYNDEGDAIFLDEDEAGNPVQLDDYPRRRMKRMTRTWPPTPWRS